MPIYWKSFPFPARVMTLLCKLLLGEDSNSEQANKSKTLLTLRTSLYHSVFFLSLSRQFAPHTFNEIKITQRTACMTVPSHLLTENAQYDVSVALPTSDAEPRARWKGKKNKANAKKEKSPITLHSFSSSWSRFRTAGDSLGAGKPNKVKEEKTHFLLCLSSAPNAINLAHPGCVRTNTVRAPCTNR